MERETAKSLVSVICILSILSNYLYTTKLLDFSTYLSSYRLDHLAVWSAANHNNNTTRIQQQSEDDDDENDDLPCYSTVDGRLLPQIPSFILVGAQKAGTSALYFLLEKMSDIEPSLAFEAHFFDQREPLFKQRMKQMRQERQENINNVDSSSSLLLFTPPEICQARQNYLQFWDNNGTLPAGHLSFEKTPVYLCKPEIPALIRHVVPWAKIVVLLRNPVDRAYSGYRMLRERVANESEVGSFEQAVTQQVRLARDYGHSTAPLLRHYLELLNNNNNNDDDDTRLQTLFALPDHLKLLQPSADLTYDRLLTRGMYARQIINWLEYYTLNVNIKIVRYEVFVEQPSQVLNDILAFVGAKHPHKLSTSVLQSAYRPTRGIKRNYTKPMSPLTREYLEHFYEPYNQELADLLGEEWRDVWKTKLD